MTDEILEIVDGLDQPTVDEAVDAIVDQTPIDEDRARLELAEFMRAGAIYYLDDAENTIAVTPGGEL